MVEPFSHPESSEETSRDFWERRWQQSGGDAADREVRRASVLCAMVPEETQSVLEVGCGSGVIINRIAVADTMGVDISAVALRDVTGPSLQCSADALPFEDGRYDLVIASEVLEHLPAGVYESALSEIARVAAHNILISVPNREYLKSSMTRCPLCGFEYHRSLHERSYAPGNLKGLFKGFKMVSRSQLGDKEPKQTRLEVLVRRLAGRWASPNGTVCPNCMAVHDAPVQQTHGVETPRPAEGALKWLCRRHKASWLAALYERT